LTEQHNKEAKKYYEYYYTWSMAEAMRKKHRKNGRRVCVKVGLSMTETHKKWLIWYNREKDSKTNRTNRIIPTRNARLYDK